MAFVQIIVIALAFAGETSADVMFGRPIPGFEREATEMRAKAAGTLRPELSDSHLSPGGAFRVHYATAGDDAVPTVDLDGDSVPDWVEHAAIIADSIREKYREMGYDMQLVDGGVGGGSEFDLYFKRIPYYGLTYNGSDPFIMLHRSFADRGFASHGLDALRVTIAHEMFHAIQNSYARGASSEKWLWLREMSATFMEDVLYDNVNDFVQYLNPSLWQDPVLFEKPDRGIDYYERYSVYPYGSAVFLHFLMEKYGNDALVFIREAIANHDYLASAVMSKMEARIGLPAEEILADFWMWNYFSGGRFRSGFYRDGGLYRPAPLESPYQNDAISARSSSGSESITRLGAHLLRLSPDRAMTDVSVHVRGSGYSATNRWAWRLVVAFSENVTIVNGAPVGIGTEADEMVFVIPAAIWLRATDAVLIAANGASGTISAVAYTYEVRHNAPTAIAASAPIPERSTLGLPSPNPFNAQVVIPIVLSRSQPVDLVIYDATGRSVRTLLAGVPFIAGHHQLSWDGRSDDGRAASSGVFLVRMSADGATTIRRIALVR